MERRVPRTVPGWFKEIELAIADARAADRSVNRSVTRNRRQSVPPGSPHLSQVPG